MNINFKNIKKKVFLAPMAGINDPAFRLMCQKQGAGITFTELISIDYIYSEKQKALKKIQRNNKEKNLGIQLFGKHPEKIKETIELLESRFDFFDLNAGCPAHKIVEQGAGVDLMKKPELLKKMLTQLINNTNKPVTLKYRLGINEKQENFLQIGRIAEDLGVEMITLHARYANQGYSGNANWKKIKELKQEINVYVTGNGDIKKSEDAQKMFQETNTDFVMIGRWALGNPWCFSQTNYFLKTKKYEKTETKTKILGFLEYLKETQNFDISFARKKIQAMHFTKGIEESSKVRTKIALSKNEEQIINTMNSFLDKE